MPKARRTSWIDAGLEAWSLGAEASLVVGMRIARIAGGGARARDEAQLMVREKIEAAAELQSELIGAAFGSTPLALTTRTLRHYRRKVAANRQRLSR